jgi:hypothetical protein
MPMTKAYKDIVLKLVENERSNVEDNLCRYKRSERAGNDYRDVIARHEERLATLEAVKREVERS